MSKSPKSYNDYASNTSKFHRGCDQNDLRIRREGVVPWIASRPLNPKQLPALHTALWVTGKKIARLLAPLISLFSPLKIIVSVRSTSLIIQAAMAEQIIFYVPIKGWVTYAPTVEAFTTGIKILDLVKTALIAWSCFKSFLIAWFIPGIILIFWSAHGVADPASLRKVMLAYMYVGGLRQWWQQKEGLKV